ncbi:DNA-directed RNA polymerase specialized sigma24 family protein [Umezawaea tangerina]|uniref:DNA-directed RNA polymerase specialized sigma24 family protein n=1 Tax=Umezawaea tangerina TaxID=84725 RepID=A0A2T0T1U8_9PSEU|nr:DNA-directed RNA polymerase specialized sigma24 family protein [Umezawaea tangerina]
MLFDRHVEAVWNHAHRLTGSWERAQDVTSATFLAAWLTRAGTAPVGDSALPLLYSMAGEEAGTARRRPPSTPVDDDDDVLVHRVDELADAVRRLPRGRREVAELCLLGGLPVADVAAHLGVAEAAVRADLALAVEDLPVVEVVTPRALPAELKARLRAEFDHGPEHRPRRSARLLVVAAAMVLLAGTVFVLRQPPEAVTRAPQQAAAVGPVLDEAVAAAALDRCWTAVGQRGTAGRYPDRSRWRPVFTVGDAQVGVVAARADGKPLFCQTTPTTATVSDPDAAPATGTSAVLVSREGVVAGVTDVDWRLVGLDGSGPNGVVAVRAETSDHLFVARTGVNPTGVAMTISETGSQDPTAVRVLTAPTTPAVVASDRPDGPAPDRTSEAGRALGDCLARSAVPLPDPDSYQTGAAVTYPGGAVVLGRSSSSLVTCESTGDTATAVRVLLVHSSAPAVVRDARFVGDGGIAIGGELAPEVATVEIGTDDEPLRPAAVAGGTFAAVLRAEVSASPTSSGAVHAVARDATGAVLFENFWQVP